VKQKRKGKQKPKERTKKEEGRDKELLLPKLLFKE